MALPEQDPSGGLPPDSAPDRSRLPADNTGLVAVDPDRSARPIAPTGGEPPGAPDAPLAAAELPPRRQHPAWIAISAVRQLRGFALPLLVLLLSRGREGDLGLLSLLLAVALVSVALQAVSWWFVCYSVEGGRFRVESGVFARRERFVPLERIQAVDLGETPLQRLFGVVGVRIETAGGASSESDVVLQAVRRADAETLRTTLLRGGAATSPVAAETDPSRAAIVRSQADTEGELLRRLSPREIVVAGATSGRIGPALAVVSFGFQALDDLLPDRVWRMLAMQAPGYGLRGLAVALAVGAIVAWGLSIAGAVLTWSRFELRRDGDRLVIAHGLLDRRRRSVPLARLQAVAVRESPLRRLFGLAEMRFESAGWAGGAGEAGVLVPLLRLAEVPGFLAVATPGFAPPNPLPLARPPSRARGRFLGQSLRLPLALLVVAVAVAGLLPAVRWWWGAAVLVLAPLAAWDGLLAFRETGWCIAADRFVVRNGGLARGTVVAPIRRLQWRAAVQTPFARRARLATLFAAVATRGEGGRLRMPFLDEAEAYALLARLAAPDGVRAERRGTAGPAEVPQPLAPGAIEAEATHPAKYT